MQKTSSGPSVGIVTRTKNRTVLLRRALESVRNQSFQNWKLVVVNDGGDPGPVDKLIKLIFEADSRVQIIHHSSSQGMEAASNAGITLLETDYAIIHDDDDSWAPDFLSVTTGVMLEKRKKYPSIRGIVTHLNAVYETVTANMVQIERVEPWYASQFDRLEEGLLSIQKMLVRNQFPPIAFLFDLKVCKELGMFDAELPVLGDWDFHTRFVLKNDIWVHPEFLAFYHHRVTADGVLGNSVHAGGHLHREYRQILRNKWIRSDLNDPNGSATNRMAILLGMEIQDQLQSDFQRVRDEIWSARWAKRNYRMEFIHALKDGERRLRQKIKGIIHAIR